MFLNGAEGELDDGAVVKIIRREGILPIVIMVTL